MKTKLCGTLVLVVYLCGAASTSMARSPFHSPPNHFGQFVAKLPSPYLPDTIVDPPLNWPLGYGVQQTGEITASFDCYGNFGLYYYLGQPMAEWPVASFLAPSDGEAEYLFSGSVWLGGIVEGDTSVSIGNDGWGSGYEFYPPGYTGYNSSGSVTRFAFVTDFSMRAEFNDTITEGVPVDFFGRPHRPLNVKVANRSHVWRQDPFTGTVVYDMVVTNIGDELIEKGYLGFFYDGDCVWVYETGG